MPLLRSARALRPTALLPRAPLRAFTTTPACAGGHGTQLDPPTGWLFGVKPGEEYKKEGWETATFWVFIPLMLGSIGLYAFKPDTSIQTWALEEARRRLEKEGILSDPDLVKKE